MGCLTSRTHCIVNLSELLGRYCPDKGVNSFRSDNENEIVVNM